MKDDNLPPNNETVEDGGGCYVAGSREQIINTHYQDDSMKEQDAAHSFEKFEGHTPGPWEIDDYEHGVLYTHDTGLKFHICLIGSGGSTTMTDDEEVANLALIASAPDLLDELTRLRSELQQKDEVIKDLVSISERYAACIMYAAQELDTHKAKLRTKVMDISKYDEDLKMKVIELIDKL